MSYIFGSELSKENFVGLRELSGVDFDTNGVGNGIRFILDGKTYQVTEDEDDGYRSSANAIEVSDAVLTNTFWPVKVFVSAESDDNILKIQDCITGKVIIEVGTGDWDDYYPYFVHSFDPTAMVINEVP